ncbi:MAG: hypothetical protein LBG19_02095 [Prevotellaceae bacterium]|jgi:hypothetical protein|nr:hypothetical protein [Prevotellaceae bacterium]
MISFAFIFQKQQIDFKNVDYSLPTLEMLKKAKKRYTPFGNGGALVIVPIILADIGLSITLSAIDMITFQLLYFGVILFAMLMGLLVWKIKYKPLYDNICSLIKEINQ